MELQVQLETLSQKPWQKTIEEVIQCPDLAYECSGMGVHSCTPVHIPPTYIKNKTKQKTINVPGSKGPCIKRCNWLHVYSEVR